MHSNGYFIMEPYGSQMETLFLVAQTRLCFALGIISVLCFVHHKSWNKAACVMPHPATKNGKVVMMFQHLVGTPALVISLLCIGLITICTQNWITTSFTVPPQPISSTISTAPKNVVLGIAMGFGWDKLRNFIVSLRTKFSGDVVLFQMANDGSEHLRNKLQQYNVIVVQCQREYPYFLPGSLAYDYSLQQPIPSHLTIQASHNLRFLVFHLWLSAHKASYKKVLITDTRDVVFQQDPFEWMDNDNSSTDGRLYVALENSDYKINGKGWNAVWIESHYGKEGLAQIGDFSISCSGTTIGTVDKMIVYLERMSSSINDFAMNKPDVKIFDQAVHIWILYTMDWGNWLSKLRDGYSPIASLCLRHEKVPFINTTTGNILILNTDGTTPSVVHQYDRHSNLLQAITTHYEALDKMAGLLQDLGFKRA